MGFVETHSFTTEHLWAEVEAGERLVENLGQVEVSASDCVAREA